MNLTKIINSLKQLQQKQQQVKKRFSGNKQYNYVYRNCLLEDEIEDRRVYGYTHNDTIDKFRRKHPASAHQIRPSTSHKIVKNNTATQWTCKPNKSKVTFDSGYTRCQTAHKSVAKPNIHKQFDYITKNWNSESKENVDVKNKGNVKYSYQYEEDGQAADPAQVESLIKIQRQLQEVQIQKQKKVKNNKPNIKKINSITLTINDNKPKQKINKNKSNYYNQSQNTKVNKTAVISKSYSRHTHKCLSNKGICCGYVNKSSSIYKDRQKLKVGDGLQFNMSNNKTHVIDNNKQIRMKSIEKYKNQFNSQFQQHLRNAHILMSKNKIKDKAKTVIINKINHKQLSIAGSTNIDNYNTIPMHDNFFDLTQHSKQKQSQKQKQFKNTLSEAQQMQILEILNKCMFDKYSTFYLGKQRKKMQIKRSWKQCWKVYQDVQVQANQKLKFYLLEMSNMAVRQVPDYNLDQMHLLVQYLLRNQKMLHFCIIKQVPDPTKDSSNKQNKQNKQDQDNNGCSYQLVYQQHIISPRFTLNHFQWHISLFRYYLKRFLLISQEYDSLKAINQEQKIFYTYFHKVPDRFYRFIYDLRQKSYVFIDQKMNRVSGNLGEFLEQGYKQIQQRRVSWMCKGTKLMDQNKPNKKKKQIYFYICFFTIKTLILIYRLLILIQVFNGSTLLSFFLIYHFL